MSRTFEEEKKAGCTDNVRHMPGSLDRGGRDCAFGVGILSGVKATLQRDSVD
jgi:hypothetical protein